MWIIATYLVFGHGQFLPSVRNSLLTVTAGPTFSHSASVGFSLAGWRLSEWGSSCEDGDAVSFGPSHSSPSQASLSRPITSASSDDGWKGGVARMEDIILWRGEEKKREKGFGILGLICVIYSFVMQEQYEQRSNEIIKKLELLISWWKKYPRG